MIPRRSTVTTCLTREDVINKIAEHDVKFIRLWFTDVLGFLKSLAMTPRELEASLYEGTGFDGSSIEGFARIQESDMIAMPDPSTFAILPNMAEHERTAFMFCDILEPDGRPYAGDPRYALKRVLAKAAGLGYTMCVGPELEYFYFKDSAHTELLDRGGYFDLTSLELSTSVRRETVSALEQVGIEVEYAHHECGPSQHEIDLRYKEALIMADSVMTYRLLVKEVADRHGIHATFMPKPIYGEAGSGMHVHQSLFKGENNAFFDAADPWHMSSTCKAYVAGLLYHAREMCLVTNQWVNSYKRLVPGYEAPIYCCWARRNRSALVRVPMYKPGKEHATRVEMRNPDPAANPYLAFAAMLAAGLDGIEKGRELPPEATDNIYEMSAKERHAAGIRSLPGDIEGAIIAFENSDFMRETLGEHIYQYLIRNKRAEWDSYRAFVSSWEIDRYLEIL
ncbi:MAG: glutamine synthetase family protein [Actinomycetia bacterium]|nr:glutamine synthetase family protein [Actinomycetes bacterium]